MPDMWTAIQFDSAVMTFGVWVENKLNERGLNNEPKYTLADILYEHDAAYIRKKNQKTVDALRVIAGKGNRSKGGVVIVA